MKKINPKKFSKTKTNLAGDILRNSNKSHRINMIRLSTNNDTNRSVDIKEYRKSVLVFYELNSIISFKKIFIEQYLFATQNYTVKKL